MLSPGSACVKAGVPITPSCAVVNYGSDPQADVPAWFVVESAGVTVYSEAVLVPLVPAYDTATAVWLTDWTPGGGLWQGYEVTAYTALAGDQVPGNDTVRTNLMVSTDTVFSYWREGDGPVIDGYMEPGEWSDAYAFDASNVAGWRSGSQPPGSALGYFKHDSAWFYVAFALPRTPGRDTHDLVGLYCDENNNGMWEAGLTEGNFDIWVNDSARDEVLYRPWSPSGPGQPQRAPGSVSASSDFNGHLVFEARIPLGTLPYQLNLNPVGDTCGLWLCMVRDSTDFGWWRLGLPADSFGDPAAYGTLVLQPPLLSGDVGVDRIIAPTGRVAPGGTVAPQGAWRVYGTMPMSYWAYAFLDNPIGQRVYRESLWVSGSRQVAFPTFNVGTLAGAWTVVCSTRAVGDMNPANDWKRGAFDVGVQPPVPGWHEVSPSAPGTVARDGAWLAGSFADPGIYCAKGNKTGEFYRFDPAEGNWQTLAAIPPGSEGKLPYKGATGVSDSRGHVYTVKGNNTLGFHKYSASRNAWLQLADIPVGGGKKVKGGSDLAYVGSGDSSCTYLLKGQQNEFYRYVATGESAGTWQTLAPAPGENWAAGSWLCYDGADRIYAQQARTHTFHYYSLSAQAWRTLSSTMPFVSRYTGKSKKSKDGGSAAWWNGSVYALKGGGTQEFYKFTAAAGAWTELDTIPLIGSTGKKVKVKAGGDIVNYADWFYALKGSKTNEFWTFREPGTMLGPAAERSGVMAGIRMRGDAGTLAVVSNPVRRGPAAVRCRADGPALLSLFDPTGRLAWSMPVSGKGLQEFVLPMLAPGAYLLRLEACGIAQTAKLVVQR